MNKREIIRYAGYTLAILLTASCATSRKMTQTTANKNGIDIVFVGEGAPDSVFVTVAPIPTDTNLSVKEYYYAIDNGRTDVYAVKDGAVHIAPDSLPSHYQILCDDYQLFSGCMRSTEHLSVNVSDYRKRNYALTGGIYSHKIPRSAEFHALRSKLFKLGRYKLSAHDLDSLSRQMYALIDTIMEESHPEAATQAAVYLDDDFIPYAFDRLPKGAENTLYYTNVRARRNSAVRSEEQIKLINTSSEHSEPAPEITLKSLDGQTFNISDLRGKWVVLDFWVSWCGPCRKGFEKMKKVYADYSDRLEIVGIACGDQYETWNTLVKELELPWRNFLASSPESNDGTVAGFPVPAYPTKVIIDPEGGLRDFTVGEAEDFYERLERMLQ